MAFYNNLGKRPRKRNNTSLYSTRQKPPIDDTDEECILPLKKRDEPKMSTLPSQGTNIYMSSNLASHAPDMKLS
jgi:hypothetical protein